MRLPTALLALAAAACCTPGGPAANDQTASQATEYSAPTSQVPPVTEQEIADGRRLVELACASCHEVDPGAISPHPEAPNLANLSQEYPVTLLDEAFAEGIMVGHPDMPEFKLQPDQVRALIGYLESIQTRRGI